MSRRNDDPSRETLDEWSVEAQRELAHGSAERACGMFRRLIDAWTDRQGPDGDRVLVWRGFLGRGLTEARRYREAEQVLGELLVDRARVEGDDATGTLVVRGNLARAIALGGRPAEGIVLAQRLLADRIRLLGVDHPSTLDTRGNIAHFHHLAGLHLDSVALYEDLLEDRIRVLGEDHPAVALTESNLVAVRAQATGSAEDLEALCDLADAMVAELGADHPDAITQFALVAERLVAVERYDDALGYIDWACDARARLFGEADALTVSARTVRARCLAGLGRGAEARKDLLTLLARLGSMGLGRDASSLKIRADLLVLLMELHDDAETLHLDDVLVDLWRELWTDCRHLEPTNDLRVWINELADVFGPVS